MIQSLFSILLFMIFMSGCNKDQFNAQIPSYLYIESITLDTEDFQGSNSQKITDSWVTMDGVFLGVFEVPCTIPILDHGIHEFTIYSGIKVNGISATRSIYPFYEICDLFLFDGEKYSSSNTTSIELFIDSTVMVKASTKYKENVSFIFIEDFEDAGSVFEISELSDTVLINIDIDSLVFEGNSSGFIELDSINNFFEIISSEFVSLSDLYKNSMLELDYRCNHYFKLGVAVRDANSGAVNRFESIQINPSEKWNKIYIHMTNQINIGNSIDEFGVFIGIGKVSSQEKAKFYFDNIKWIHEI